MNSMPRQLLHGLFNRPRESHKYDYGRVFIIGGSQSMAGAPVLAGRAALRSGAGVVELCVPTGIAAIAAGFDPCLITHGLPSDASDFFSAGNLEPMCALAAHADVIVCGPGLGRSPEINQIVKVLWQKMPQPMVFDADALFALAQLTFDEFKQHAGARILTPHAGEMHRLLGMDGQLQRTHENTSREELELAAKILAQEIDSVIVLKGPHTLITDGAEQWHNATGNPGMATAGSGDVLSGIIAALLAQGLTPLDAARLGAWVHGLAGDAAAQSHSEIAMVSTDLIDCLPETFKRLQHNNAVV